MIKEREREKKKKFFLCRVQSGKNVIEALLGHQGGNLELKSEIWYCASEKGSELDMEGGLLCSHNPGLCWRTMIAYT